ncbi:MAG: outer membrane lipid asymmetry maintenance protein MlaD [Deltaproteobacteria bacterium]|nr:outer membrane lipid asymmetry maintenance protein MlaD [Deltaproteobacteria bacterium]
MKKSSIETSVGIFMFICILCVAYLTIHLGKMDWIGSDYYQLQARFQSVSGLKAGASVEMAGVQIGNIQAISLNQEKKIAEVTMNIQNGVQIEEDAIASIKTAGLIGDKYIMILPGGSDTILKQGETIFETESAVDLEDLISKYLFGDAE